MSGSRKKRQKAKILAKLIATGAETDPRFEDIAGHFIRAAGGPAAIAKILYQEFLRAPQGSLIRQRILEMVLRAAKFAAERRPPPSDLGLLSDDDLELEIAETLGEASLLDDGSEAAPESLLDKNLIPEVPYTLSEGSRDGQGEEEKA
jgi:hypothetical protein